MTRLDYREKDFPPTETIPQSVGGASLPRLLKGETVNRFPSRGNHQLRKGRQSISGAHYFLTTSTFNQKPILSNSEAARIIFEIFEWLEAQGRIRWICITIMSNHLHAVIQLGRDQTLPKVMRSLKTFTARQINKHRDEHSTVWQEGYYDHGIRRDESLNEIIHYCYENPVRQGLVKQAKDYPYWRCKIKIE